MNNKRLYELDGLRGIAALIVVFYHYFYHYNHVYGHTFSVPEWISAGYYGVHLFFMISGFVIFWTLSRSKRPMDFVWSRFSRLYPVFWAAVTLTFLTVLIFGLPGREVRTLHFLANLSMIHQYINVKHVDSVYWTLTLELAFYFWMLMLFTFDQLKNIEKWLILWVTTSIVFTYFKLGSDIDHRIIKFFLLDYVQFFSAGVCFFKIWESKQNQLTYFVLALTIFSLFVHYTNETAILLGLYFILFFLAISGKFKLLSVRPLVFLGTISYSLYLIHQNIGYIIIRSFYNQDYSPYFGILAAILFSFLLATFLTFFVEKPTLKYFRNYYKHNATLQKIANKLTLYKNHGK